MKEMYPYTCGTCRWNDNLLCDAKGVLVEDDEEGCNKYEANDISDKTGPKPGDPGRKPYQHDT